ncbi:hypothetical protein DRN51_07160 [Thermococci archaeon]|nr:MAG: hypothetical protein DRN51_07160 [Thermococci archaeon]
MDANIEDIRKVTAPAITDAIQAFREGKVIVHPGGGGKYGIIELPSSVEKTNTIVFVDKQKTLLDY